MMRIFLSFFMVLLIYWKKFYGDNFAERLRAFKKNLKVRAEGGKSANLQRNVSECQC